MSDKLKTMKTQRREKKQPERKKKKKRERAGHLQWLIADFSETTVEPKRTENIFSEYCKKITFNLEFYTVNPQKTWVWTARVHLHIDFL